LDSKLEDKNSSCVNGFMNSNSGTGSLIEGARE